MSVNPTKKLVQHLVQNLVKIWSPNLLKIWSKHIAKNLVSIPDGLELNTLNIWPNIGRIRKELSELENAIHQEIFPINRLTPLINRLRLFMNRRMPKDANKSQAKYRMNAKIWTRCRLSAASSQMVPHTPYTCLVAHTSANSFKATGPLHIRTDVFESETHRPRVSKPWACKWHY